MASPIPVLPLVASTTVCPGLSRPVRSASSMTPRAKRSLTDPIGLKASNLTYRATCAGASFFILTTGVRPIVSRMLSNRFLARASLVGPAAGTSSAALFTVMSCTPRNASRMGCCHPMEPFAPATLLRAAREDCKIHRSVTACSTVAAGRLTIPIPTGCRVRLWASDWLANAPFDSPGEVLPGLPENDPNMCQIGPPLPQVRKIGRTPDCLQPWHPLLRASMQVSMMTLTECHGWLPAGKRAAVCFSVDDVHPATSQDEFDAGGDLGRGALGRLERLVPTRKWLTRVPVLRERVHWAPLTPRGHFRIDRFPKFVAYLNAMPRTDCALHGLNHAHPGPRMAVEFQEQSRSECSALLQEARQIFATAGLRPVQGFAAPAWSTPPSLCEALSDADFHFVTSARDLDTPVSGRARTAMSGVHGASLIHPMWIRCAPNDKPTSATARPCRLMHFTTNFQATSTIERARHH